MTNKELIHRQQALEDVEVQLHTFKTLHYINVNVLIHNPATSPWTGGRVGPTRGLGPVDKR